MDEGAQGSEPSSPAVSSDNHASFPNGASHVSKGAPEDEILEAQKRFIKEAHGPQTMVVSRYTGERCPVSEYDGRQRILAQSIGDLEVDQDLDLKKPDGTKDEEKNYNHALCISRGLFEHAWDHYAGPSGGGGHHIVFLLDPSCLEMIPESSWERAEKVGLCIKSAICMLIARQACSFGQVTLEAAGVDVSRIDFHRDRGSGMLLRTVGCPESDGKKSKNYYPKNSDGTLAFSKDYESTPNLYFPGALELVNIDQLMPRIAAHIEAMVAERERNPLVIPEGGVEVEGIPCFEGMAKGGYRDGERHNRFVGMSLLSYIAGGNEEETVAQLSAIAATCEGYDHEVEDDAISTAKSLAGKPFAPCKFVDKRFCDRSRCALFTPPARESCLAALSAKDIGDKVSLKVQLVGQKDLKALPRSLSLVCDQCSVSVSVDLIESPEMLLARLTLNRNGLYGMVRARLGSPCSESGHRHVLRDSSEKTDFAILYVRDIIQGALRFTARTAIVRELYLIGTTIPVGNKLELEGTVTINPKTNDIAVVASEIHPLREDFEGFVATEDDKRRFGERFQKGRNSHLQLAPHIVGERRELPKRWAALVHHSLSEIPDIKGRMIRGSLRICFFGDSTVGKTEIGCEGTDELRAAFGVVFGEAVKAETSSRTGLLYTINTDNELLKWGALPLNDRGYVCFDGFQKLSSDEMGEYREALRSERVKVNRSLQGEAPMRVRQIACMNPNKSRLGDYLFPCQGILDSKPFRDPVDVTRWDAFIPFSVEDVEIEKIAVSGDQSKPMTDELYDTHLKWAWSRKPEQVVYEPGVAKLIEKTAVELHHRFHVQALPLVNNDIRAVLTRTSVAFASFRHSTDEYHEKVIVTEACAEEAFNLLVETYDLLKLDRFKEYEMGRYALADTDFVKALADMDAYDFTIIDSLKSDGRTSTELAAILGIAEENVRRKHYDRLTEHELIETSSRGCRLGEKGWRFVKALQAGCDSVTPFVTESLQSKGAVTHKVTESQPPGASSVLSGDVQQNGEENGLPKVRSMEETVTLVKKVMNAAFGPVWAREKLEDVGKHLAYLFEGDAKEALIFFKRGCEEGWLPYIVRADEMVVRRA